MTDAPPDQLTHNRLNAVTGGIWRAPDGVHKVLTRRRTDAPAHWSSSDDPRHWNYWRREALAYQSDLPARLGLGAPTLIDSREAADGDIELRLEDVAGRHSGQLSIEDIVETARVLGRSQGRREQPVDDWLSRGFLRDYSTSRPVDFAAIDDDRAWTHPLISRYFPPDLRDGLRSLHHHREQLLDIMASRPRTICHLDVWPNNIVRRPTGEVVLLDWAFVGDGALGEDIGNLIPDCVFDLLLPYQSLDELDARATTAYLEGLAGAGWSGDENEVRLGICASAVKYDWLTARCLQTASADEQFGYGGQVNVAADDHYAARSAGLALCARWAAEARQLV